jgi:uncharacterized protein
MWLKVSGIILRNKIFLLTILALITVFFGYHALKVEMSYEYVSLLPKKDPAYKDYQRFVEIFGEEGNIIIIGIQDTAFFELGRFRKWGELSNELSQVEGVEDLLSVTNAYNLVRNTDEKRFEVVELFPDTISTQEELNKRVEVFRSLPFYRNLVYNPETNAYILAITVNKDKMHTKERENLVRSIQKIARNFELTENVELHYSGLPYIRVINSIQIRRELYLFSVLALAICIVVLFVFFRSLQGSYISCADCTDRCGVVVGYAFIIWI